jgi:KUP system potassium uptake protein
MLLTTMLLFIAMQEIWHWPRWVAVIVAGCFAVIDGVFVLANGMKIAEGGWVPLLLAIIIWSIMAIWHRGTVAVAAVLRERAMPLDQFMKMLDDRKVPRVPGSAVFLTRATHDTPPVMLWHVKHNRALHEHLIAITCQTESIPYVDPDKRVTLEQAAPHFWRMIAHYGFMERPDIPLLLAHGRERGCTLPLDDVTYYVGHETVIHRTDGPAMPLWEEVIFAFMVRNAATVSGFFSLPRNGVVEIGRLVEV